MKSSKRPHPARTKAIADALAGAGASLIALWVFYPVDVWKTNIQASSSSCMTASTTSARHIQENWSRLFAGWRIKTLHTALSSFSYFYLYSWIYSWWTRLIAVRRPHSSNALGVPTRLLLSAIAAMLNTCVTLPFDVLSARHQTRISCEEHRLLINQQTALGSDQHGSDYKEDLDGATESEKEEEDDMLNNQDTREDKARRILSRSSVSFLMEDCKPLWKGLVPSLLLCTNPSIHYTVFDLIKARVLKGRGTKEDSRGKNLNMAEAFVLGLIAKFVATVATYPLIRAKAMLMVTCPPPTTTASPSQVSELWDCLVNEYRKQGLNGLYRGCGLQLFHTVLKSALVTMMRERISRTTHRIMSTTECIENKSNQ